MRLRTAVTLFAGLALVIGVATAMGGGAPVIAFSPTSGNFGTVDFGSTSDAQTFTLSNSGGSASGALKVSITGANAAQFTITANTCSAASIGPKKSCQVTVQYTPSAVGSSDSATLTVSSKKPPASASVALSGTGTAAPTNHPPVANPDFFQMTEDAAVSGPYLAGNVLVNDTDIDGDVIRVSGVSNVSVDVSHAGSAFTAMTATLTNGDPSINPAVITLSLNGQTATISINQDGFTTVSDPNNLFNVLASGESITVNAYTTISDTFGANSTTSFGLTVLGQDEAA